MARAKKKKSKSILQRLFVALTNLAFLAALAVVVIAVVYGLIMSRSIAERFDGRRWSVPSRVYSDGLVIFPGQGLPIDQLTARLDRLGYQRVGRLPRRAGQYRREKAAVRVFLRAVDLPVMKRRAMSVRIEFAGPDKASVASIKKARNGTPLPVVELEPEELMQVFGDQHESRQLVSVQEVPQSLIDAVLAAEDADFYRHGGFDVTAMVRALYVNATAGQVVQGGSTITQQLAKTFFLSPDRHVMRKLKELVIAVVIEVLYTKQTILEIYLNEVYLGQRGSVAVHGFGEAARFYFGKSVDQLTVAQCAVLAGIIRTPARLSPYRHPQAAMKRRNEVLRLMNEAGKLDDQTFARSRDETLETVAYAPYTRMAPYFFDYVATQLSTIYRDTDLTQVGLSLYTTIDVGVQAEAERALVTGLAKLEEKHPALSSAEAKSRNGQDDKKRKPSKTETRLQGAIVVVQPSTGHILAMVGGRDYAESQFNRITQARRQPGSAFKPFVYLAALEELDFTARLDNETKTYDDPGAPKWRPKNYSGKSGGTVTMRHALTHSLNLPTVALADRIGLTPIIDTAQDLGITSPLEPRLSLALGAFEVVPLELAMAYAALAHDGVRPHPLSLRSVVNAEREVVRRQHLKLQTVTTPARAYMMSEVLRNVVDEGTGRGLKRHGIDYRVAGKTGTTNGYRDAWFVGYTPDLVTLVWVGFDDNASIRLSASKAAVPIWADLMRSVGWRTSKRWFEPPEGVVRAKVCSETGHLAIDDCPNVVDEVFETGREPAERCQVHRSGFQKFLDAIGL